MPGSHLKVDPEVLRVDASRWDAISAAFNEAVDILGNEATVYGWYLDSLTRTTTDWQSRYVENSCNVQNFSYRGRDAISGCKGISYGIAATLRTLANLYEQTDADESVSFQHAYERLGESA